MVHHFFLIKFSLAVAVVLRDRIVVKRFLVQALNEVILAENFSEFLIVLKRWIERNLI